MLVLTRKRNESIIINDNIEIIVVDIKGDQIKLGIKAPKKVSIHRKEVYEEIQKENKLAAEAVSKFQKIKEFENLLRKK